MQTITSKTLEDTMYYGSIPVLTYKITYPAFTTTCSVAAGQIVNAYYADIAADTEKYCRTTLYSQAAETARYIQNSRNRPFNNYTLDMAYTVTYNKECITSLYTDTYTYTGGAHGETKRTSDTWNFKTGSRLTLNDIYPLTPASLEILKKNIEQQIAERLRENPGSYFEDYTSLLQASFNPAGFYLRPGGFVIYFQQYDIAPYSTGLPEFQIQSSHFRL